MCMCVADPRISGPAAPGQVLRQGINVYVCSAAQRGAKEWRHRGQRLGVSLRCYFAVCLTCKTSDTHRILQEGRQHGQGVGVSLCCYSAVCLT